MEPLILKFGEDLEPESIPPLQVEYSEALNLSILKTTGKPAVSPQALGTETHTRKGGEGSDTDKSSIALHYALATETFTKASGEGADTDRA